MVSDGWRQLSLNGVVTLQRGYDLPHRNRKRGNVPVVSSSGILDTHSESRASGPGVVTGRYGTIGEVFFVREDYWPLNTTLFVSDFHDNDPLFISYLLRTIDYHSYSGKSGVPGVNRNDLYEISVSLPPIAEQRSIAGALSDMDELVASLEQLVAKKRSIKQATMQELLTGKQRLPTFSDKWQARKLQDLATVLKGAGLSKTKISPSGRTPCILYGELFTTYQRTISEVISRTDSLEGVPSEYGDVLVPGSTTTKGADLATASAVLKSGVLLGGDINVVRAKGSAYDPVFLAYCLTETKKQTIAERAQGITIIHLYGRDLLDLEVSLPPLQEQMEIINVLADMDAEIAALEQRRDKTRAVKQGMMQELLTGRRRLV